MATALQSSRLSKACPDHFICLIDFYLFNETISNHFVRSEGDFKAWNCNSLPLANQTHEEYDIKYVTFILTLEARN